MPHDPRLELFAFRYRDARIGKWVRVFRSLWV